MDRVELGAQIRKFGGSGNAKAPQRHASEGLGETARATSDLSEANPSPASGATVMIGHDLDFMTIRQRAIHIEDALVGADALDRHAVRDH